MDPLLINMPSWLLLTVLAVFEFRRRAVFLVFPVAILLLVALPLSFSNDLVVRYGRETVAQASYLLLIFSITSLLARLISAHVFAGSSRLSFAPPPADRQLRIALITSVIACWAAITSFVFGLRLFSLDSIANINWWDFVRSNSPIVLAGTYLSYASSAIVVLSLAARRKFPYLATFGFITSFVFLLFCTVALKTRSYVLIVLFPPVVYLAALHGVKVKIGSALFMATGAFAYVYTRSIRHAGTFFDFVSSDILSLLGGAATNAELNLVDAFVYFVWIDNRFPGFGEGTTLMRILTFWAPSRFFDIKPEEFSYTMHAAYFGYTGSSGLSMHPTIIGDAFANHGLIGCMLYPAIFFTSFSIIELASKNAAVARHGMFICCLLSVSLLTLARGAVYNSFMFLVVSTSIYLSLHLIVNTIDRTKARPETLC